MKQVVRLNESQLKRIIAESIKRVVSEGKFDSDMPYDEKCAYRTKNAGLDTTDSGDAWRQFFHMKRRGVKNRDKIEKNRQAHDNKKGLKESVQDPFKDKVYDIYVSVIDNDREMHDILQGLASTLSKHIQRGEHIDIERLANSSVMQKIVKKAIDKYNRIGTENNVAVTPWMRKDLNMWTASKVFHILDDMGVLPEEDVIAFENSPWFSISEY